MAGVSKTRRISDNPVQFFAVLLIIVPIALLPVFLILRLMLSPPVPSYLVALTFYAIGSMIAVPLGLVIMGLSLFFEQRKPPAGEP